MQPRKAIDGVLTRLHRATMPALTAGIGALAIAFAQAQEPAAFAGSGVLGKLTTETRQQALECGRKGLACAVVPYQLCPDDRRFSIVLVTPFSRGALAAVEAASSGRPLGRMGPAAVNRWGISVHISPPSTTVNPEPIERMELRREGRVIQPMKATVGPVTLSAGSGPAQVSMRGAFDFPPEAFEPSAPVQLILVGPSGEFHCTLERARLQTLR
jgi:hypothetical protein